VCLCMCKCVCGCVYVYVCGANQGMMLREMRLLRDVYISGFYL
jgi:hypothetical protein